VRLEGWASGALFRQLPDQCVVATGERFFLGARPAFELTLDSNGIGDVGKMLGSDHRHGQTFQSVSAESAVVVLGQPSLEPETRRADVEAAIGAA
jgi:hypothetical protein